MLKSNAAAGQNENMFISRTTHPPVDVGWLQIMEHLARAAAGKSSDAHAPAWHSERPVAGFDHSGVAILQQCAIGNVSEKLLLLARHAVLEKDTTLQLAVNAVGFLVSKPSAALMLSFRRIFL